MAAVVEAAGAARSCRAPATFLDTTTKPQVPAEAGCTRPRNTHSRRERGAAARPSTPTTATIGAARTHLVARTAHPRAAIESLRRPIVRAASMDCWMRPIVTAALR